MTLRRRGYLVEKELPRRGKRYVGIIVGDDNGRWKFGDMSEIKDWDWYLSFGIYGVKRVVTVGGTTEHNSGLRKAIVDIVRSYPEFASFELDFDGSMRLVSSFFGRGGEKRDWRDMVFYHGTSSFVVDDVLRRGLAPRSVTGLGPVYGTGAGAKSGRDDVVYLTTQIGMAKFAASEAAKKMRGEAVVLRIRGISGDFLPDEDSREASAEDSLKRMGSVAFRGVIRPARIEVYLTKQEGGRGWVRVQRRES